MFDTNINKGSKGVTIAGINAMEHAGFTSAVMKGMMGSYEKIIK